MALAVPLIATKGHSASRWSARTVAPSFMRGAGQTNSFSLSCAVFGIIFSSWSAATGARTCRSPLRPAENEGLLQRALAHRALGSTLFFLAALPSALDETDQAIAIDDALEGSDNDRTHLFLYGERPGILSRLMRAGHYGFWVFPIVLWHALIRRFGSLKNSVHQQSGIGPLVLRPVCRIIGATSRQRSKYADAASRVATKHDLPLGWGRAP